MLKDNFNIIKRYYSLIKDDRNQLIPFYFSVFLNSIIDLIIPIVISNIINLITKNLYNEALIYVLILASLYGLNTLFAYLDCKIYSNFLKCNYVTIHRKIIKQVYDYDEDYQQYIPRGKILNSISMDLINISEMADYFYSIFIQLLKLIIILFCFIKVNFIIAIIVLILDIVYIRLSYYLNKKSAYYFSKQRKSSDVLISLFQQVLIGLKDIKTLNLSSELDKKFNKVRRKWQKNYITRRKYLIVQKTILKYIIYTGKIFLYFISIYLISIGKLELGTLLVLVSYYDKAFESSIEIMNSEASIKEENISMERIYQLLEYNNSRNNNSRNNNIYDKQNEKGIVGTIEFKNVYFAYKIEKTLKNISFSLLPNKLNVIVGKTGSGKTTLFNLLTGLYEVKKGSINIGGCPVENIDDYSKYISILNQDTYLFNLSIKENLDLICKDTEKQINICKKIGIHEFIINLPKGYNTVLSENSTNLSGGQKRLLSLARTLLSDKQILLFDEVTSSLDIKTTINIINLLQEMKKNHTIIVISHKKEMMEKSDYLLVINKGKKVGEGTHKMLLKNNKYYQQLYKNIK